MIISEFRFTISEFCFWCYRNDFRDIFEDGVTSGERYDTAIVAFHEHFQRQGNGRAKREERDSLNSNKITNGGEYESRA